MNPVVITGMKGLGDNIYQIPIVKHFAKTRKVYLATPWPQLFSEIPGISFISPETKLRTQVKNMELSKGVYEAPPEGPVLNVRLNYAKFQKRGWPIHKSLVMSCPTLQFTGFNYHLKLRERTQARGNYIVIRPPTIRSEWPAPSRNPKMLYIQQLTYHLTARGFETIVLADIDPPAEVYDGPPLRGASKYIVNGELNVTEVLDLIYNAKLVIGGVGFIAPMCIALGTPALIIHGGAGGWNAPEIVDCPGEGKLTHVLPIHYCKCQKHAHRCRKEIDQKHMVEQLNTVL